MNTTPTTDQDWTTQALNIHGDFFERWCQKAVTDTPGWKVIATNYPVAFPHNAFWQAKESALDIRADFRAEDTILTLLIECKKNDQRFIDWIFFPKNHDWSKLGMPIITETENRFQPPPNYGWKVQTAKKLFGFNSIVANEARETRGSYLDYIKKNKNMGELTKTSNDAITDAAKQVALATQSVISEQAKFTQTLGSCNPPVPLPYRKQVFLPVIVTTAQLFACEFDVTNIDVVTGTIPLDNVSFKKCPYLLYEYPLPRSLQHTPEDLASVLMSNSMETFSYMDILIINSEAFTATLSVLAERRPLSVE